MKNLFEIELIEGEQAFIDPDAVIAIAPAHRQSNLGVGSILAGSMLVLAGGTTLPVKGSPNEVWVKIASMVAH